MNLEMTQSSIGLIAVAVFIVAYILVMSEELFWFANQNLWFLLPELSGFLVAIAAKSKGMLPEVEEYIKLNILDFAELFLFLLVAMTYVNSIEDRQVFESLRGWLTKKKCSYRTIFWLTGILAFFISPIADNMTTALIFGAIVIAVGGKNVSFISASCINIVVAANAGGAFSPFGDITTLMVWQKGTVPFFSFFNLFLPCVVNFLVPALILQFAIPKSIPEGSLKSSKIQPGGIVITLLFLLTIALTIISHHLYHIPPAIGMMMGLGLLQFFGFYLRLKANGTTNLDTNGEPVMIFDIFKKIRQVEWDTLLFFYGVIFCIGGLSALGFLELASHVLYDQWGQTPANITIGILSAIVDNIPLMFAVLTMEPSMPQGQWLLVTLTAGVGGSLLSIGSAAGVALMGQAKGYYTFLSHLKWAWAIALGYFAAIITHLLLNRHLFEL